jgi:hypothetical protein
MFLDPGRNGRFPQTQTNGSRFSRRHHFSPRFLRSAWRETASPDPTQPRQGPAPLIATWLFVKYNSAYAVAVYIFVCAVLTLIATAMMKDYTGKDIEGEYE